MKFVLEIQSMAFNLKNFRSNGFGMTLKVAGSPTSDWTMVDIKELLKYLNYKFDRQTGSHQHWTNMLDNSKRMSFKGIAGHNPGYSLTDALKQCGVTKDQLEYYIAHKKKLWREKRAFERDNPGELFPPRLEPKKEVQVVKEEKEPISEGNTNVINWSDKRYYNFWKTVMDEVAEFQREVGVNNEIISEIAKHYHVPVEEVIKRMHTVEALSAGKWYKKAYSTNPDFGKKPLTLGRIVITRGAEEYCQKNNIDVGSFISRHASGDWGDLSQEDKETNATSLTNMGMIMSSYLVGPDKIWIITDPGWRTTTILLPDEY